VLSARQTSSTDLDLQGQCKVIEERSALPHCGSVEALNAF